MKCLEEQRTYRTDEHRRIGMDPPDRVLLTEPTLAISPNFGMLGLEVTGNEVPYSFRDGRAGSGECPDHHVGSVCGSERRNCRRRLRRSQVIHSAAVSRHRPQFRIPRHELVFDTIGKVCIQEVFAGRPSSSWMWVSR